MAVDDTPPAAEEAKPAALWAALDAASAALRAAWDTALVALLTALEAVSPTFSTIERNPLPPAE
jgi:hypothetical protein